jgi:glycosyltransferase involved in cell wall biosynthesis
MEYLVSIIIPTYSRPKHLQRAIDSCLKQTYTNIEVIVVDDNNPETEFRAETESLMELFKNNGIKYIKHEYNKNGAAARNTGIKNAKGDYLAFLDDDDEWDKYKIEKQISIIDKASHIGVVYCKALVKSFKGDVYLPIRGIIDGEHIAEYLFSNHGMMQTSTMLVNAKIAREVMFDEELIRHQDFDFVLRLIPKTKVHYIDEALVTINWHDNTLKQQMQKGQSVNFSKKFAVDRRELFTEKSFKDFILGNVVHRYIFLGEIKNGIKELFHFRIFSFKVLKYILHALFVAK